MTQIGIMIEGQDGTNWKRWQRLLQAAEDFGYQCLFRSDHFTNAAGADKDSLELWVSLTYAAIHTKRIEFGPLVAPVTFRHPALTVRMAAQVDDLSGGRLVLGLGAGWQEREHHKFGIPFHGTFARRYEMLEEALELTMRLFMSDGPVNFAGKHFSLDDAILLPRPTRPGGPPILIGGKSVKRTLPLVARYADEWNVTYMPPAEFKTLSTTLDELLKQNGREPGEVKRSLMTGVLVGKTVADVQAKLDARNKVSGRTRTIEESVAGGMIVGTPSTWVDQIGRLAEAGVQRIMLQWLDQDDIDGLELVARDVLPHFHKG